MTMPLLWIIRLKEKQRDREEDVGYQGLGEGVGSCLMGTEFQFVEMEMFVEIGCTQCKCA